MQVLQYIVDLGATVMIPIVIFIVGLIFGNGIGKSLKSGISVGIGFTGISLVISLLTDNLGKAAEAMAKNFHLGLNVVDVGWPGTSPLAWASNLGLVAIVVSIIVNAIMLLTKMTKVVNVDIWNIWHMAFTGAIVQIATGSFTWGIVAIVVHAIIAFKLGDIFKPVTDNFFELEGISIPHGSSATMGIFAKPIDDLIEAIPGLRDINISSKTIEKKFGVFGQPSIIGAVLGLIIGLLAGFSVGKSLQLAIQMAAVMVLMPVVVKYIMEGLIPISESAKKIMDKHFKNSEFTIGMDPALLLGDADVIAAGLLFVPITLLIAMLMPGNRILPFGDLATIGFFIAIATGVHKGNIFRTLISGSVIMTITLWISNQTWQLQDKLGRSVGLLAEGKKVGSLDQGGNPITYLLTEGITKHITIGFIVILVLYVAAFVYTYVSYKKNKLY
ncbi:PTS galactitol transporter subunit IIC [Ligilactobacillus salivarius]|uniref:PTS galactitol transporter subunit IIC n=1 Tax=Ligilactobacillus salivarius TaxID=1624 RepID=A0A6A8LPS0_9LACO|nr:PTS transporter subunit IIC [Ligilactobacillus salivarius]MSE04952.1 PTS galactitol transporter subunit IIC [Ligilactobacillus salivarius]MSE07373.1 PTS galactitol transporter subunit IIC [Ligilactobacillus salivarius]WHS05912.1 PTS galactitol transporter subunit IIC [Ligilactobacillus salivarius]WHS08008.1 PTS galactitol transporter subunit IIC [Ligilactobacillus salivarius]WHS09824.1 PTS galactitol transporter subunit IIC [Ligilactobacillus salivarius]